MIREAIERGVVMWRNTTPETVTMNLSPGDLTCLIANVAAEVCVEPPLCPFCKAGTFLPTGTLGRLACSSCGSIALDGRKKVAVKIEE